MSPHQSMDDLKRIAIAKHGEDEAYLLASRLGNPNHKKSWLATIAMPSRSAEEVLDHQLWQREIQLRFFRRTF